MAKLNHFHKNFCGELDFEKRHFENIFRTTGWKIIEVENDHFTEC